MSFVMPSVRSAIPIQFGVLKPR